VFMSNPSPDSPQGYAFVALDVILGPPTFGTPTLKLRKDVRPPDAFSPLNRLCSRCARPLPRRLRASTRFCSTSCRVAWHRQSAAGAGLDPSRGGDTGCNARAKNTSRVEAPLDIFGHGHRWPVTARLNPELRRRIIQTEVTT
jgi:hypothetical protein